MRKLSSAFLLVVAVAGCGGGGGKSSGSSSGGSLNFSANSIVYGEANGTDLDFSVVEVSPTGGTPKTVVSSVDGAILAFALDSSRSGRYVLAADPSSTGRYGLYLSKNLSLSGATTLVSPNYVAVGSMAVTPDGSKVVYTATLTSGASELFVVTTAGGVPADFGAADAAALSPADGDTVVFTAPDLNSGAENLYQRSLAAGTSSSGVALAVAVNGSLALPAFNRDGTQLSYWSLGNSADGNALIVKRLADGSEVSVPGVAGIEPQGTAFGPDGTTLAIVGQSLVSGNSGIAGMIATAPANGSASPTTIVSDIAGLLGNYGFFWTDANGRATSGSRISSVSARFHKRG